MDLFAAACENFNLIGATEKTVVMHLPPPNGAYVTPQIHVNNAHLQVVNNFTYVGSTLSRNTKIDNEVARRNSKTSQAFVRLQNKIWKRHGLRLNIKLKIYKAVILPRLLYGAESWTAYKRQRTVKTGVAIFEAFKGEHETRKSQLLPPPPRSANAKPHPTCPRCQRTFRAPNGLVRPLRTNCSTRPPPATVYSSNSPSPSTLPTNVDRPPEPPLSPSSSSYSTAATSAAVASAVPINTKHNSDTPTNTNTTTINTSDEDRVYTCPHCDRTFTSHIGLVGHMRIHRTDSGEPEPGAPTHTRRILLHCPPCTCTFIHRMGLLGHMRVHDNPR
ncbi:hypothetical protein SprV_0301248600 [Sparganum proliferum]